MDPTSAYAKEHKLLEKRTHAVIQQLDLDIAIHVSSCQNHSATSAAWQPSLSFRLAHVVYGLRRYSITSRRPSLPKTPAWLGLGFRNQGCFKDSGTTGETWRCLFEGSPFFLKSLQGNQMESHHFGGDPKTDKPKLVFGRGKPKGCCQQPVWLGQLSSQALSSHPHWPNMGLACLRVPFLPV